MLIELRRKLDKIARGGGSREARILRIGKHSVQRMTELVKHRRDVVEADERGLSRRGFRQICHVIYDRQGAEQLGLADKFGHPRAAVLVVALEVIGIKKRQRFAVDIGDLENTYVRFVHRNILSFLEGYSIQPVRRVENAVLKHIVEFEKRLDLRLVEIIFGFAHLLAVELAIPRLQLKSALLRIDHCLHILGLGGRLRGRHRHQRVHELQRRFGRLGHLVLELPSRVAGKAENARTLGSELGQARDDLPRVVGISLLGTVP